MDIVSFLFSIVASGTVSVAVVYFLSEKLVEHRLSKDLKDYDASIEERLLSHRSELDRLVNEAKVEGEARLKREVEEYLGDKAADRTYHFEARRRLYLAVGPLRFQLLISAAELANRVIRISDGSVRYSMSIGNYYARSTVYRLLRVLAVGELVERQVAFADFAVDPAMRAVLRFKRQAFIALSSDRVSLGHPDEDWGQQKQHLFYDVLGVVASTMITSDEVAGVRVLRFDEFVSLLNDKKKMDGLQTLLEMIDGFSISERPIFWLRLLALAQLCLGLVETQGREIGLEFEDLNVKILLENCADEFIRTNHERYQVALDGFRKSLMAA